MSARWWDTLRFVLLFIGAGFVGAAITLTVVDRDHGAGFEVCIWAAAFASLASMVCRHYWRRESR